MQKFLRSILFFSLLFIVWACTEQFDDTEPSIVETNFFPLETGNFRDYSVTERIYFTSTDVETRVYQIREEVGKEFQYNQVGSSSYELKRYSRIGSGDPWVLDSLWLSRIDRNPVVRSVQVENNVPFIKLVFPVAVGKSWDGNAMNNRSSETYEITEIIDNYDPLGSLSLPQGVKVLQQDDDDELTIRDIRYEVYSPNIGMVHRYNETLKYCSRPECLGQKIVESGRFIEMKLIEHGKL
jgi:hypothetical protein